MEENHRWNMLQVEWITREWNNRADIPQHVVTMLNNFPAQLHPMSQFSAAITALNLGSKFAKAYSDNVPKAKYWEVSLTLSTKRHPNLHRLLPV